MHVFFFPKTKQKNWPKKTPNKITYLYTHTWGRRRKPALARRRTSLTCHQQMSCRKLVLSQPWSVCPRRPQPCKIGTRDANVLLKRKDRQTDGQTGLPYETSFGSVDEMPPVSCVILPADVFGVMPQSAYLRKAVDNTKCNTAFKPDIIGFRPGVFNLF